MAIARNAPFTRFSAGSFEVATMTTDFLRPRFVQVAFQKFTHFAAAFADERDDVHVGLGLRRHHAEQRGFADAAAGENAEALAAAAGHERVHGLDAGLENIVDALALERMRRAADAGRRYVRAMTGPRSSSGWPRPSITRPLSALPTATRSGAPVAMTSAAGMNAVDFAQRHQQQMVVPKADDFRQRLAVVPRGFNPADFADRGERAFRFDDQADELARRGRTFPSRAPRARAGRRFATGGSGHGMAWSSCG